MLPEYTITENCYKPGPEPKHCAMKVDRVNGGKSTYILNFSTKQRIMFSILQSLISSKRVPNSYQTESEYSRK
jgi:hypothetical protein